MQLEEMIDSVEERMNNLVQKPSTRVQACQLLAKAKVRSNQKKYLCTVIYYRIYNGKLLTFLFLILKLNTLMKKATA